MSFSRVRGQPQALERLQAAISSGRLAHAYLFTGPAGVGKRTIARELARATLCEAGGSDACDRCASCRAVEAGTHPDYGTMMIEESGKLRPIEDSDREIKIASIRELTKWLSLRSTSGRARAFLIPGAERMNEEAANALLKTLEEPVGSRLIILTSARPEALLPTVISRVARVRLRSLTVGEVAEYLASERGMTPAEAAELAAASGGSIGAALTASLGTVRAARSFVMDRLARPVPPSPLELSESMMEFARTAAESGPGKDKGLEPLRRELLGLWRQAAAVYRAALGQALGEDSSQQAPGPLVALGPERLRRAIEALLAADRAVREYSPPELVCRVLAGELASITR